MFRYFSSFVFCCAPLLSLLAQQKPVTIKLDNPSFESFPGGAQTPQGWFDCGFPGESPPDTHPSGAFEVTKKAAHGDTYLGLVVRDNNTWEAVGQRLKSPMLKGVTYKFSLMLARSESYVSQSRNTNKTTNYVTPVALRIWGGNSYCQKSELLGEAPPVSSGTWLRQEFKMTPKTNYSYITIEAFYKVPTVLPYCGNILIDNASDIVPETPLPPPSVVIKKPAIGTNVSTANVGFEAKATNVSEKKQVNLYLNGMLVKNFEFSAGTVKASLNLQEGKNDIVIKVTTPTGSKDATTSVVYKKPAEVAVVSQPVKITPNNPPPKETQPTEEPKFKQGQVLQIEKLEFAAQSSKILSESYASLDKIYTLLASNPNLVVEIGGHTNLVIDASLGERLSAERAIEVKNYLVQKGIDPNRLRTKGYGKTKPIVQGTSAAANKANQRVELKILGF